MSVSSMGKGIKHFKAVCPVSKVMVAQIYSRATSWNTKASLEIQQITLQYRIYRANADPKKLLAAVNTHLPKEEEHVMDMYQQNWQRYIDQGIKQGLAQGLEQGRQEGLEEGQKAMREVALRLFKRDHRMPEVKVITGLSDELLKSLAKEAAKATV